jgi:hypothetical protein
MRSCCSSSGDLAFFLFSRSHGFTAFSFSDNY